MGGFILDVTCTYIHTYIHTYVCIYIRMYVYTYIQYSHTNIHTYILSELGLAQSEDSFQLSSTTKLKTNKRTVTSRVDCLLETVFSISRQEKGSGRQEDLERGLQQGTSGRFTTRTEDLCTVHRDL